MFLKSLFFREGEIINNLYRMFVDVKWYEGKRSKERVYEIGGGYNFK